MLLDAFFQLICSLDILEPAPVQVEIDDVFGSNTRIGKFLRNSLHQAGLSAAANPRNDLDYLAIMVKSADFLEIAFPGIILDTHTLNIPYHRRKNKVKGVYYAKISDFTPLNRSQWVIFAL